MAKFKIEDNQNDLFTLEQLCEANDFTAEEIEEIISLQIGESFGGGAGNSLMRVE